MTDIDPRRYTSEFASLGFDVPEPGILRITLERVGTLNSADASMHRDLAQV